MNAISDTEYLRKKKKITGSQNCLGGKRAQDHRLQTLLYKEILESIELKNMNDRSVKLMKMKTSYIT